MRVHCFAIPGIDSKVDENTCMTFACFGLQGEFKGDLSNSPLSAAAKKGNVGIQISGNPRYMGIRKRDVG